MIFQSTVPKQSRLVSMLRESLVSGVPDEIFHALLKHLCISLLTTCNILFISVDKLILSRCPHLQTKAIPSKQNDSTVPKQSRLTDFLKVIFIHSKSDESISILFHFSSFIKEFQPGVLCILR
jgi:hypothetical protein